MHAVLLRGSDSPTSYVLSYYVAAKMRQHLFLVHKEDPFVIEYRELYEKTTKSSKAARQARACPGTATLDHTVQSINAPVAKDLQDAFVAWMVLDAMPFSFVERPGMQHFFDKCLPAWKVPTRKALSAHLLDGFAQKVEKEALRRLEAADCITVTVDGWKRDRALLYGVMYCTPEPVLVALEETNGASEDAEFLHTLISRVRASSPRRLRSRSSSSAPPNGPPPPPPVGGGTHASTGIGSALNLNGGRPPTGVGRWERGEGECASSPP